MITRVSSEKPSSWACSKVVDGKEHGLIWRGINNSAFWNLATNRLLQ